MSDAFDWDEIDNSWKSAKAPVAKEEKKDFEEVPDGSYSCVVERAEFRKSKSGNPYLSMALVVDSGPHEGRWMFKRNMLRTEENLSYLKKDLAVCGVAVPDKLSDLKLESLLDLSVKATKKTKDDFENIYIDRLISEAKGDTKKPVTQEYNDDDIPF
tara:strand:- start:331 stop:801 length:471 start_codon:yes stop_codon:yes gene_type:complete